MPNGLRPSRNVWASHWYGDYVIIADNARGIDILKYDKSQRDTEVVAPKMNAAQQRFAPDLDHKWAPDPESAGPARCRFY